MSVLVCLVVIPCQSCIVGLMSCVKRACSVGHPLVSQRWCWVAGETYVCG